jgi:precorrin-6B methylase 2
MIDPRAIFHHPRYLQSVFRRLEQLAVLSLPIEFRTVLEIGAGIGDMTSFFLDRGCTVTSVEPREENIEIFRARYSQYPLYEAGRLRTVQSTIADLAKHEVEPHDVVCCQQVLNFVPDPESAIAVVASCAKELLLLETGCDSGEGRDDDEIRVREYDPSDPSGSITGNAYLPTRRWIFNRLKRHFPYVYVALLQAQFSTFSLYWGRADVAGGHSRLLFVASRSPLDNALLADFVPTVQFSRLPGGADLALPEDMRFVKTVFGPMVSVEGDRTWQEPYDRFDPMLRLLNAGDIVYDLGADIGMRAVAFGVAVGERGVVMASEHRQSQSAALEHNVRSHRTRNVRCNTLADSLPGPAALMHVNGAGMSDADWRIAAALFARDRPVVRAEDPQILARVLERLS